MKTKRNRTVKPTRKDCAQRHSKRVVSRARKPVVTEPEAPARIHASRARVARRWGSA